MDVLIHLVVGVVLAELRNKGCSFSGRTLACHANNGSSILLHPAINKSYAKNVSAF